MADVSPPAPQTIAAVLADVDGTLVTKSKALTPRAIDAIEQLHERGVRLVERRVNIDPRAVSAGRGRE